MDPDRVNADATTAAELGASALRSIAIMGTGCPGEEIELDLNLASPTQSLDSFNQSLARELISFAKTGRKDCVYSAGRPGVTALEIARRCDRPPASPILERVLPGAQ